MIRPRAARIACFGALLLLAAVGAAQERSGEAAAEAPPLVLQIDITGPIGPAAAKHLADGLKAAEARGAAAALMRLNTPGGLASSMRDMIADILAARVPVIGYVAPPGAHAASAGTYLLYATHVAAMAPGTNLGAATPVQIGGMRGPPGGGKPDDEQNGKKKGAKDGGDKSKDSEGDETEAAGPETPMERKAVNDAVAFIRSLAELRGRNAEWAETAVRDAASLSAKAAQEQDVIDFVAADVTALLQAADGRETEVDGAAATVRTANARVEVFEPSIMTKALGVLANPNVAFVLMMIGVYGLIFEFANPGAIGPGIAGVICLILAFYALNQLPLDYAGLALIAFGVALMVVEAFSPAFGVFGIGGLIATTLGAAMLIDTDQPAYQIDWKVIAGVAAVNGLLLFFVLGYAIRAHRQPLRGGAETMIGAEAKVLDWSEGQGHVLAAGERWRARGAAAFQPGDTARIERLDGLTLEVCAADEPHQPAENRERSP